MKKLKQFLQRYSDKNWHYIIPVLNTILIVISIWLNTTYNGGFCVFVPWAMVVQIVCFINMVTFMWLEQTPLWRLNAFLCGISTGVFFYWVIFSEWWVIFFPVSILFIFLLVWRNVKHPVRKQSKPWYFCGNRRMRGFCYSVGNPILFCGQKSSKRGIRHQEPDDRAYSGNAFPLPYPYLHLRWMATAVA